MSTLVSGVMKDPFERPIKNALITLNPINNSFVLLAGKGVTTATDENGEYSFVLEPASYQVLVTSDGRSPFYGAITVTANTAPSSLNELILQSAMEAELPLNYAEYFQQIQVAVKADADRAESAADDAENSVTLINNQVEVATQKANDSAASAVASEQSSQNAQQALADTREIADKFTNLDEAVQQTADNRDASAASAAESALSKDSAKADADRAEQAASQAETVNERSVRAPGTEVIQALPSATLRANAVATFDAAGDSVVTPLSSFAQIGADGKIPLDKIPSAAITEVFPVSSQAEMLALTAQAGDVAIVNDSSTPSDNGTFILMAAPATDLSNWKAISTDAIRQLSGVDGENYVGGATYAQIRAYAGSATRIQCLARASIFDGGEGLFYLDPQDTTTLDDDGTVLVDSLSRRWKRSDKSKVKAEWFGATGDWNATTKTGTDSTSAIQAAINALSKLPNPRNGGARCLEFGYGSFYLTSVNVSQAGYSYGFELRGKGSFATLLYGNPTDKVAGCFRVGCEYVVLSGCSFIGVASDANSTETAIANRCNFFVINLDNKAADVDIRCHDDVRTLAVISAFKCYGRGVQINGGTHGLASAVCEIVVSASQAWPAGGDQLNGPYTGIRNIALNNMRTDYVDHPLTISGDGVSLDYINAPRISNTDILGALDIIYAPTATLRGFVIEGCTGAEACANGLFNVKGVEGGVISTCSLTKSIRRDGSFIGGNPMMNGLFTATGAVNNLIISDSDFGPLRTKLFSVGAESSNITISNVNLHQAFVNETSAVNLVQGANVNGLVLDNIVLTGSPTVVINAWNPSVQTGRALVKSYTAPYNIKNTVTAQTPSSVSWGGTAVTPTVAVLNVQNDGVYCKVRGALVLANPSLSGQTLNVFLRDIPSAGEFPSVTSGVSGGGTVHYYAGAAATGSTPMYCQVSSGGVLTFRKTDNSPFTSSDISGQISIMFECKYRL